MIAAFQFEVPFPLWQSRQEKTTYFSPPAPPTVQPSINKPMAIETGSFDWNRWLSSFVAPMPLSAVPAVELQDWLSELMQANGTGVSKANDEALIQAEFNERADRWETETAVLSSPSAMYLHSDYISIISRGMVRKDIIIPLILERITRRGGDWFFALEKIAGENAAKDCEHFQDALNAWKKWAKQRRLLKNRDALSAA